MDKDTRSLLVGLVLGDGCIQYRVRLNNQKYKYVDCSLRIGHSEKQLDYLKWKVQLIKQLLGGKENKLTKNIHRLKNGKSYITYSFQRTDNYFRTIHHWIYDETGKKRITRKVLDFLSIPALAIWFMDDGSCSKNINKYGKVSSIFIRISTYCSELEADEIIQYFSEEWGISAKKGFEKGSWIIRFNTNNSVKLANLIEPYILPSLRYKIQPVYDLIEHECGTSHRDEDIV